MFYKFRVSSLDSSIDPAWFESIEVEKILFDMLGPDYDEVVMIKIKIWIVRRFFENFNFYFILGSWENE